MHNRRPMFAGHQSRSVERVITVSFWLILLIMLGRVMGMDYHDQFTQAQVDCQDVHIWWQTRHEYGHPPLNEWERTHCLANYVSGK